MIGEWAVGSVGRSRAPCYFFGYFLPVFVAKLQIAAVSSRRTPLSLLPRLIIYGLAPCLHAVPVCVSVSYVAFPLIVELQAGRKSPSKATLLKYVKIATSFKEAGLEAMKDVTYLNDREKGHSDFNTFGKARAHVTLKMLVRPEFQEATEVQQEVYILRLARQVHLCGVDN